MDSFDKRMAALDAMTPEEGFNLVGVDDYEEPGDELYLVGNYPTKEEAERVKQQRLAGNPQEVLYIYEPDNE